MQRSLTWNFPANPEGLWSHFNKNRLLCTSITNKLHRAFAWAMNFWFMGGMSVGGAYVFRRMKKQRRAVWLFGWRHRQCVWMLSIKLNEPLLNFLCLIDKRKKRNIRQFEPIEYMNIFQSLSMALEKQAILNNPSCMLSTWCLALGSGSRTFM